MASAERHSVFYAEFQARKKDILKDLEDPINLTRANEGTASLQKILVDAAGDLPAYDQRQYETQIKELQQKIESERNRSVPTTRFAFRKKAAVKSASQGSSTSPTKPATETATPEIASQSMSIASRTSSYIGWSSVSLDSSALIVSDLDSCIVNLIEHRENTSLSKTPAINSVHVKNLMKTIVLLPHIEGSAILDHLQDCIVFRIHSSQNSTILLLTPSHPIIEYCSSLSFGSYPRSSSSSAELGPSKHAEVQDFGHLLQTPSPNWHLLSSSEEEVCHQRIERLLDTPPGNALLRIADILNT
ncbi:hypothetical protein SISNIDRAFT_547618 [Sistotremastrum niveocremeum HHB9708]|uniref:C-CAP/cofactor C-like domain-containing protein n=1 Tax=Sistotremastrum niveocremeum HHB9708 TaxID=1314777 RepID=A0A164YIK8_9AGAM|nr:hypothetical protein SISNIDRAFT_547618 [Sistotremastrum niveocremeum HHB9708]